MVELEKSLRVNSPTSVQEAVRITCLKVHNLYKSYVNSGLAFGAKRWVAPLNRQCERFASAKATNIPRGSIGVL